MEQDRKIELLHALEQRQKLRRIERLAVDVGEHLDAAKPELTDRALHLAERGLDVAHGQAGTRGHKTLRVLRHELRHLVIRDPRGLDGIAWSRDAFDVRSGLGKNLHDLWVLVHHPEPRLEIGESWIRAPVLRILGSDSRTCPCVALAEVSRSQDVREDVDDRHHSGAADTDTDRGSVRGRGATPDVVNGNTGEDERQTCPAVHRHRNEAVDHDRSRRHHEDDRRPRISHTR